MSMLSDKKKNKTFLEELKEFALSWDIVEMALSWVLGTIAWELISSIIGDILFPFFGIDEMSDATLTINGVVINYGSTLSVFIGFIFVVLLTFGFVKLVQHLRTQGAMREEEDEPSEEAELLKEMRDLLIEIKEQRGN